MQARGGDLTNFKIFSPGWETRSLSIVLGNSRKKYILFLSVTNDESTANQSIWIHGIYSFSERAWFLNLVATHSLKNSKLNDNRLRETLIWRNIYIHHPMTIRLIVLTLKKKKNYLLHQYGISVYYWGTSNACNVFIWINTVEPHFIGLPWD